MTLCPSPKLSILVDSRADDVDIHLHAGGQGYWNARMIALLGVPVVVCGYFGGETGQVLKALMNSDGVEVRAVEVHASNVAELRDPQPDSSAPPIRMKTVHPSRHDVDSLYGIALASGLQASICVLAGDPDAIVPRDMYMRLAHDLHDNGRTVVADLTGDNLDAVLEGGVDVVKVSHSELMRDGRTKSADFSEILRAVDDLARRGVPTIVVSRAAEPAVVYAHESLFCVGTPKITPVDHRGAGDSMTAGIAAGLAQGRPILEAIRLGAAAGALNATRRGLATGTPEAIQHFVEQVHVTPYREHTTREATTTPEELAARTRPT
jgi:1-phosphofructokinase